MSTSNNQTEAYDFQSLSVEDLFKKLAASFKGLSEEEASKRLKEYGYNEISEKKVSPFLKFLAYFWGPIPWMIEIVQIRFYADRVGRSAFHCIGHQRHHVRYRQAWHGNGAGISALKGFFT